MRLITRIAVVVGSAAVIVACGGGSSGGGEGGGTSNTFAVQYCDLTGGVCCPKQGRAYNGETCRALVALGGVQEGVTYDAVAGEQCLGALRAAQSQPAFCNDLGGSSVKTTCDGAFKRKAAATKKPGDVCERDSDCALDPSGEVECSFSSSASGGTDQVCVLQVRGKDGDECAGDKLANSTTGASVSTSQVQGARVNVCWEADGLFCARGRTSDAKDTCKPRAAVGAACVSTEPYGCVASAYCDLSTQKCAALAAVGAECSSSDGCVESAYCDASAKKCIATVPPGGACTKNTECGGSFGSCTNGKCEGGNLGLTLFFCAQ